MDDKFVIGKLVEVAVIDRVPLMVDDALWVRVRGLGFGYLDGNPHTFRSGVGVWSVEDNSGALTSLDNIEEMSEASRAWIAGYLHGNEPDISEYLGWDGDYTDEEWRRWRALLGRYHQTGFCPTLNRRPTEPMPITDGTRRMVRLADWRPWAFAGERVWVQHGSAWVEAESQPEVNDWGVLVDSVCHRRGHHDVDIPEPGSGWEVCLDCGYVEPPVQPNHP